jgi:hypothetical protein
MDYLEEYFVRLNTNEEVRCSICKVDLRHNINQPSDSISQVVWLKPGIPGTQVLNFCKYCIERRKEGLIKGLEYLKSNKKGN